MLHSEMTKLVLNGRQPLRVRRGFLTGGAGTGHEPAAILQMGAPNQQAVTIALHGQPEGQPFVAVVVVVVVVVVAAAPHFACGAGSEGGTWRSTRVVGSAGAVR